MKLPGNIALSPGAHLALALAVAALGASLLLQQRQRHKVMPLPPPAVTSVTTGPQSFVREGTRLKLPEPPPAPDTPLLQKLLPTGSAHRAVSAPLPISIVPWHDFPRPRERLAAPFGRLIPCETVIALESNRLDTPVVGLVTEDVWSDGRLIIPQGTEVHGKAALDHARERIAASGQWTFVWRTRDESNGRELVVQGIALDRSDQPTLDGSAGLRGQIIRTDDTRELKLFAASFLSAATTALQATRTTTGALGETFLPLNTARNAAFSGSGAVLREYADQLRETIARDGFYVRVPAGKAFYLYVTETIDADPARRNEAPPIPHEN